VKEVVFDYIVAWKSPARSTIGGSLPSGLLGGFKELDFILTSFVEVKAANRLLG
jgi:hypothetical protein